MNLTGCVLQYGMSCLVFAAQMLISPAAMATDSILPAARDLLSDARSAEQSAMPLIVLVSLAGCPHCEVVRRSHLLPLLGDETGRTKPVIRQVEINGSEILRNFDGKEISHAEFARQHKVKIAPVVLFLDTKGTWLAQPLVGSMIPDFYGAYFDAAFNVARTKLVAARAGN